MAEGKQLHELTPATQAADNDLMLLQQNGIAKSILVKKLLARLVKTINGVAPDANGNVEVDGGGASVYVQEEEPSNAPVGTLWYDTDEESSGGGSGGSGGGIAVETDPTVPDWAKQPNKPTYTASEVGALPASTVIPTVPTKVSAFENDKGYLTDYTETDPTVPAWAKNATKPSYSKSEVGLGNVDNVRQYSANNPPPYPVTSVNGKTGAVSLSAGDVGARSDMWLPTYTQIGAEKSGTAASAVSTHNTNTEAHNDIRLLIAELADRLDALANSDDETLDQMAEVVAYIKANRDLIDQITTGKVSVADIVNNLTTNVSNKPLSAAQGVALKALIDAITVPTKVSQLTNDAGYLTQHQDISGKLDASALPTAINTALAQAKASGEFDGKNGTSVTVKSVSESTADGGSNVVTFSDGKTVTIKNGSKGSKGDAYTLNDTDKATIVNAVIAALPVYAGEVV